MASELATNAAAAVSYAPRPRKPTPANTGRLDPRRTRSSPSSALPPASSASSTGRRPNQATSPAAAAGSISLIANKWSPTLSRSWISASRLGRSGGLLRVIRGSYFCVQHQMCRKTLENFTCAASVISFIMALNLCGFEKDRAAVKGFPPSPTRPSREGDVNAS